MNVKEWALHASIARLSYMMRHTGLWLHCSLMYVEGGLRAALILWRCPAMSNRVISVAEPCTALTGRKRHCALHAGSSTFVLMSGNVDVRVYIPLHASKGRPDKAGASRPADGAEASSPPRGACRGRGVRVGVALRAVAGRVPQRKAGGTELLSSPMFMT